MKLSDKEKELISQAAMDLESGNHLLHHRTAEQKEMLYWVSIAINETPKEHFKMKLIRDWYNHCINPNYKLKYN